MRTHAIAREAWRSTFDSFSSVYDGESASLEVPRPDLGAQFEIERQPFRGISYDAGGIELRFTPRDGRHFVHRIAHPRRVQIEERDDGLIVAFAIESDDHPQMILRLDAPLASTLLPSFDRVGYKRNRAACTARRIKGWCGSIEIDRFQ